MRILNCLSYYRPHYSGLTVYTERLALALAARGHEVTVLTSQYDPALPKVEELDGVAIRRVPVRFKVSKGPVMPAFPYWALRLLREHDVLHLHVPQLDAAPLSVMGRALGVPVILTYHCDLRLPASPVNWLANHVSRLANHISASFANVVVTNTLDYAEHSDFLRRYREKWHVIPPPIETVPVDPAIVARMRERYSVKPGQAIIGMAARLATEKGAEVLARALPMILESLPEARVLYAGQYLDVMGEEEYARRLEPTLNALGEHWTFLGTLSPEEMSAFYSLCDVTVLPSLNSTESFGMVLVESMFCGTPVVSSDLPGMRRPPIVSGMGLTFPVGDAGALAEAILQVIQAPEAFRPDDPSVLQAYSSDQAAVAFEKLFRTQLQDHA